MSLSINISPTPLEEVTRAVCHTASDVLGMPFDMARAQYANAAKLGLIERSMLASANFGRLLTALEQLTLGPWARRR
ncbi:MAG: hypothetical protein KA207_17375 [Burkholderiaceae bacterium]|nr:hypothetical protein [Betaproteobacteria bacterium]MBP6647635.1 hypothetical protein [Burkholderiaceae bacterium]